MASSRWFLVSKPLRPPFADGSSVLVRSLLESMPPGEVFTYFGDPAHPLRAGAADHVVERAPMGHAPSMRAKISVLSELVRPSHRREGLHFFFTPNGVTSRVVRALRMTGPGRPVIQNVMSADGVERPDPFGVGVLNNEEACIAVSGEIGVISQDDVVTGKEIAKLFGRVGVFVVWLVFAFARCVGEFASHAEFAL